MAEYIEREAAKEAVKFVPWCDWKAVGNCIDELPAADVVPVKHGRWLLDGRCSECLANPLTTHKTHCPNCGAKMEVDNGQS